MIDIFSGDPAGVIDSLQGLRHDHKTQIEFPVRRLFLGPMLATVAVVASDTGWPTLFYFGDIGRLPLLDIAISDDDQDLYVTMPIPRIGTDDLTLGYSAALPPYVRTDSYLSLGGHKVDLARACQLMLVVPTGTAVAVRNVLGPVASSAGGDLSVDGAMANAYAPSVTSVSGHIKEAGRVRIGTVLGPVDVSAIAKSSWSFDGVSGDVSVNLSAAGSCAIGDIAGALVAEVSAGASLTTGAVAGNASLNASAGSTVMARSVAGTLRATATVSTIQIVSGTTNKARIEITGGGSFGHSGEIEHITGYALNVGSARVNGRTYKWSPMKNPRPLGTKDVPTPDPAAERATRPRRPTRPARPAAPVRTPRTRLWSDDVDQIFRDMRQPGWPFNNPRS